VTNAFLWKVLNFSGEKSMQIYSMMLPSKAATVVETRTVFAFDVEAKGDRNIGDYALGC